MKYTVSGGDKNRCVQTRSVPSWSIAGRQRRRGRDGQEIGAVGDAECEGDGGGCAMGRECYVSWVKRVRIVKKDLPLL